MVDKLLDKGVFVIHALKGYEYHEKRIVELFSNNNINYEFVTEGDPSLFSQDILDKYFVGNIKEILSKGILSCTLNHIYAYERIVERNLSYALVFENDLCFLGDFVVQLRKYASEIENLEKGFIVSLENSALKFPSYWQTKKDKVLYRAKAGRMAGAYIIDLEGAKNILDDLVKNKCENVIDWWHNSLINRGVIRMYWAHPPITEQGSHNGRMSSALSNKGNSMKRRIAWTVQKAYKYYIRRVYTEKDVY